MDKVLFRHHLLVSLVALCACNPLHKKTNANKAVESIEVEAFEPVQTQSISIDSKWHTFGDARLVTRLDTVFEDNLSLAKARARLDAAKAAFKASKATYWPSVDFSASRSKSESFMFGRTFAQDQWTMSLAASYELDVFNRFGALRNAARFERKASELDRFALKLSLSATYADQWFQRCESALALQLYAKQLQTSETYLALTKHRFHNGLATATEVLQQEQQLGALKSLRPQLESRLHLFSHQLALLEGRPAAKEKVEVGESLPVPSAVPTLGVPAKLLETRPDVRAARARVNATDARVAAALAGRLPNFRISGNIGLGAQSFSDLFDQWLFGLTASALAPIFDGGRRKAEVEQQRALLDQALKHYRETYLTAIKEVKDALVLIQQEDERLSALLTEQATAKALLAESKKRYLSGLGQHVAVLNALQALQRKEREVLGVRRAQLTHRISLWRALGGAVLDTTAQIREEK